MRIRWCHDSCADCLSRELWSASSLVLQRVPRPWKEDLWLSRSGRCQGRRLLCESGRHRPASKRSDAWNPLTKQRDVVAVVVVAGLPHRSRRSQGRRFLLENARHTPVSTRSDACNPLIEDRDFVVVVVAVSKVDYVRHDDSKAHSMIMRKGCKYLQQLRCAGVPEKALLCVMT